MRRRERKVYLTALITLILSFSLTAQIPVHLSNTTEIISLGKSTAILEDKSAALTFEQIKNVQFDTLFRQSHLETPNFNVTRSAIWCKLKFINHSDVTQWQLEQMLGSMGSVELFRPENNKTTYERRGLTYSFSERKPSSVYPAFYLNIPKDSSCLVYLRLTDCAPFSANLKIGQPEYFVKRNHTFDVVNGFYTGMMVILMLHNLFIYFSVKERTYIYYVFYILFATLFISMLTGYVAYLPDVLVGLVARFQAVCGLLFGLFAVLFTIHFLQLRKNAPKLLKINYTLISLLVVSALLGIAGLKHESILLIQVLGLCLSLVSIISGYIVFKRGYKPAKFYLIAWGTYMACMVCYILTDLTILPFNMFTHNALQMGSVFEAILLSIALADKISSFKNEKEEAQAKALMAAMENEKLIKEQNIVLEFKVKERTAEIEKQKKVIEERQKEILDSIHYAKRIQKSLLPSNRYLEKKLKG